ncbi:MAG: hypothetical protein J6N51_11420 [Selenomonas sp.]|nr:hypothetical protein [Selenomonas sp.]
MQMNVLLEVPDEIVNGLANGTYTRYGGVIRGEGKQIVTLLKDAGSISTNTVVTGINPQMAILTVAIAAGFMVLNEKMNQINKTLTNIVYDVQEIKEIVDDIREFQFMSLDVEFKHALTNANRGLTENNYNLIEQARSDFNHVGEFMLAIMDKIINKNRLISSLDMYIQCSLIYYICAQADIHCSMALNQYDTVSKDVDCYQNKLDGIQQEFSKGLMSSLSNDIESLSYKRIESLKVNVQQLEWFKECTYSNLHVAGFLKENNIKYIEYEDVMKRFTENKNAVACQMVASY